MASTEQRVAIVIPARYGSTRLPGKPLADIAGKPMVQHVYERALQVANAHVVVIATDDERVAKAVRAFGGECVMTSPDHPHDAVRLHTESRDRRSHARSRSLRARRIPGHYRG